MKTKRLYEMDPYQTFMEAVVIEGNLQNGEKLIFDQTVFIRKGEENLEIRDACI